MKNKLILFDWGNIVDSHTTGYTCYDAYNDLFNECGYKVNGNVFNQLGKYKLSSIASIKDFKKVYELMAVEFNFNKSFEEFVEIYKRIFDKIDYYKEVAQYETSLRDRCYIGIFSNLTIFDKERLDRQVNLSLYDYVFLSCEIGAEKAELEIYEEVQKKLPFKPENILFIDDKKENIEIPSKMGWNVLQATGLEFDKIKQACEQFINKGVDPNE